MTVEEFYQSIGGDYQTMMLRFQSKEMILHLLTIFLRDTSYEQLTQAIGEHDAQAAFHAAHNLKGAAMSLELGIFSDAVVAVTESLRSGWTEGTEPAYAHLAQVREQVIGAMREIEGLA